MENLDLHHPQDGFFKLAFGNIIVAKNYIKTFLPKDIEIAGLYKPDGEGGLERNFWEAWCVYT